MVTSYTQLLARNFNTGLDDDSKVFVEEIVGGAKRMSLLLKDLLAYTETARDADVERTAVDLNQSLKIAVANCYTSICESGAQLISEPLPTVLGQDAGFSHLFQNLLSNAIKYRSEKIPVVHVSAERRPLEWLIRIEDNGVGIPAEHQKRIFGVFKRLHGKDIPGTGIGLAICQRVVERMGGRIWVESEGKGRGSCFCFTVPVAK